MENFKINNFDNQEREQNGFEESETLSLEYLNGEDRFSKEDRAEIELSREKNSIENREQLLDIYDKIETSGREKREGKGVAQPSPPEIRADPRKPRPRHT